MEKRKIKISAVQMCAAIGDKKSNFEKIKQLTSLIEKTDVIVLPEVWTVGWSCKDFIKSGEYLENSETIKFLSEIAKEKKCNIIGGSFVRKIDEKTYFNTCPVIDRQGQLKAK